MSRAARSLCARCGCAAALALAAWAAGAHPELFTLERGALEQGQLWRLWTGHLVHGSPAHYAYDVGVAGLLTLAFGRARDLLWMAPVCSLLLLGVLPGVDHYYGLSACLHGWVVAAAADVLRGSRGHRRWLAGAFIAATLAKALLETCSGASLFTAGADFGGPVLHASHLVGAVVGLLPGLGDVACRATTLPRALRGGRSGRAPSPGPGVRPAG